MSDFNKKNWVEVCKDALSIYLHRDDYAYFYGAKGEVLTDSQMEYLWNAEPEHFKKYTDGDKQRIFKFSRGKIGYDCSGFVGKLVNDMTYSGSLWEHCENKKEDVYQGNAGCILYRKGHVGIDIGYGYGLHFPSEGHTCELFRHKEGTITWLGCGEHRNIDYSDSDNR